MKEIALQIAKYLFYLLGVGWAAHIYFVNSIGAEIDSRVKHFDSIRKNDIESINSRLDRIDKRMEKQSEYMIQLIINKEGKK